MFEFCHQFSIRNKFDTRLAVKYTGGAAPLTLARYELEPSFIFSIQLLSSGNFCFWSSSRNEVVMCDRVGFPLRTAPYDRTDTRQQVWVAPASLALYGGAVIGMGPGAQWGTPSFAKASEGDPVMAKVSVDERFSPNFNVRTRLWEFRKIDEG